MLFVGLVFSVYLHHSVGVASISGLMRAEISIIRATALLIPKLKILHHFLKIVAHLHHYLDQVHHLQKRGWSGLERLCFYFCGLSIFLVLFAAPFMQTDLSTVQHILLQELLPWRL